MTGTFLQDLHPTYEQHAAHLHQSNYVGLDFLTEDTQVHPRHSFILTRDVLIQQLEMREAGKDIRLIEQHVPAVLEPDFENSEVYTSLLKPSARYM